MTETKLSLPPTGLARIAILGALMLAVLGLPSAAMAQEVDEVLMEDIHSLVMNTWDEKMARQYKMGVEMPVSEVAARLDIAGRWAKAIEDGVFGADKKLPEGFADQYKGMLKLVKDAEAKDDTDLDPVLVFLEKSEPALQKASGLNIPPPM